MNTIENKLKNRYMSKMAENCLILTDGMPIDCTGGIHERVCMGAGISLLQALRAGICRTHYENRSETFAIECRRCLTDEQKKTIRSILKTVNAHNLVTEIAGVYNVKQSFRKPIRGLL